MEKIKIKSNDVNLRLSNFVLKIYPNMSRNLVFKLIRLGKIKVNDKKQDNSYRLKLNDEIEIFLKQTAIFKNNKKSDNFLLASDKLDKVYEDKNLLVVNKPPKLLVCDQKQEINNTLINQVKKYLFQSKQWGPKQENQFVPCLVHRLDFNTSGLVMVAKNHQTAVVLSQKLKIHQIKKFYLCLVHGKMKKNSEVLKAYLTKQKNNFVNISLKSNHYSKYIATRYKVLNYDKKQNTSLLEIELLTGRTHQIRSHLAFIHHPLVGEQKYTSSKVNKNSCYKHQVLIAYKLFFVFSSDAEHLNYLNGKDITLSSKKIKLGN